MWPYPFQWVFALPGDDGVPPEDLVYGQYTLTANDLETLPITVWRPRIAFSQAERGASVTFTVGCLGGVAMAAQNKAWRAYWSWESDPPADAYDVSGYTIPADGPRVVPDTTWAGTMVADNTLVLCNVYFVHPYIPAGQPGHIFLDTAGARYTPTPRDWTTQIDALQKDVEPDRQDGSLGFPNWPDMVALGQNSNLLADFRQASSEVVRPIFTEQFPDWNAYSDEFIIEQVGDGGPDHGLWYENLKVYCTRRIRRFNYWMRPEVSAPQFDPLGNAWYQKHGEWYPYAHYEIFIEYGGLYLRHNWVDLQHYDFGDHCTCDPRNPQHDVTDCRWESNQGNRVRAPFSVQLLPARK